MEAHCARCPDGASAAGNADPTLCDGAPVYEFEDVWGVMWVMLRVSEGGGTRWYVSGVESLADCAFHPNDGFLRVDCGDPNHDLPCSDLNPGRPGYAPTAPAYGQWSTPYSHESISVVAGGGR